MKVEERMVLCNVVVEMGAKNAYIQTDEKAIAYLDTTEEEQTRIQVTDLEFIYDQEYAFDVGSLDSKGALPNGVNNCANVMEVHGERMEQVIAGSYTRR